MSDSSNPNSIRFQYNRSFSRSITLIFVVFSLLFIAYNIYDYRLSTQNRLNEITALAKTSLPYAMWNMDESAMSEVVKSLTLSKDVLYVALIMDGNIVKEHSPNNRIFEDFRNSWLYLKSTGEISYEETSIGEVQIVLSQRGLIRQFLINFLILFLLAAFLIKFIQKQSEKITQTFVFNPIIQLEQQANLIASGELETRLTHDSNDEIGNLSSSLDKMRVFIISLLDDLKRINKELENYNLTLEKKVEARTLELKQNNEILDAALTQQEKLNRNILDSIHYAKLIQHSILPSRQDILDQLPHSFIIWEPKDIVGGDIYFYERMQEKQYIAVIDCTGHGVPGAFMTMIAATSLKTIISSKSHDSAGQILTQLNIMVKTALGQDKAYAQSDDGMDLGLCIIDQKQQKLTFAGAKTALFYIQDNEIKTINGDRMSVGYKGKEMNYQFTDHHIDIEQHHHFYLTTDGLLDQKGGNKGLPFGKRRLHKLLLENSHLSMSEQQQKIEAFFNDYAQGLEHQDDITMLGFSV